MPGAGCTKTAVPAGTGCAKTPGAGAGCCCAYTPIGGCGGPVATTGATGGASCAKSSLTCSLSEENVSVASSTLAHCGSATACAKAL